MNFWPSFLYRVRVLHAVPYCLCWKEWSRWKHGTGALSWLNAEKLEWAPILLFGRLVRCSPPMGVFHETMVTVKHCPRISKSNFPCHVHTTVFGPRYCLLEVKFVLPIPPYLYRLHALMLWRLWRMQTYWSLCYLTRYSCIYIYT